MSLSDLDHIRAHKAAKRAAHARHVALGEFLNAELVRPLREWGAAYRPVLAVAYQVFTEFYAADPDADHSGRCANFVAVLKGVGAMVRVREAIPGIAALRGKSWEAFVRAGDIVDAAPGDDILDTPAGLVDRLARADRPAVCKALELHSYENGCHYVRDDVAVRMLRMAIADDADLAEYVHEMLTDREFLPAFGALPTLAGLLDTEAAETPSYVIDQPAYRGGPRRWVQPIDRTRDRRLQWLVRGWNLNELDALVPELLPPSEPVSVEARNKAVGVVLAEINAGLTGPAYVTPADIARPVAAEPTIVAPARDPEPTALEPTPEGPPDGPFGTDGFRYAGREVRFRRAPLRYALVVTALWDTENGRPAEVRLVEDVIEVVYGEGSETEDSTFRMLISDAQGALDKCAMPLKIDHGNGRVVLLPRHR